MEMACGRLICLRCRGAGRTLADCKSDHWFSEHVWLFEERGKNLNFEDSWKDTRAHKLVCDRSGLSQ